MSGYLEYCSRNAISVTTLSARAYMDDVIRRGLAKHPQLWKDALNWFFREGRRHCEAAPRLAGPRPAHARPGRYGSPALGTAADRAAPHPALRQSLMYGSGLRVMELLRLRVKDVDLARLQVIVWAGKGDKDRVTMLAESLGERLRAHRDRLRGLYEQDRAAGLAGVWLPEALERKYPGAGTSWEWFWFFPSRQVSLDPHSGFTGVTISWTARFSQRFVRRRTRLSSTSGSRPIR